MNEYINEFGFPFTDFFERPRAECLGPDQDDFENISGYVHRALCNGDCQYSMKVNISLSTVKQSARDEYEQLTIFIREARWIGDVLNHLREVRRRA